MSDNDTYTLGVGEPDIEIEQDHAEVLAGVGRRRRDQLDDSSVEYGDFDVAVTNMEDEIKDGDGSVEIGKTDLMLLHDQVAASMLHFDRLLAHQGPGSVPVDMLATYRQVVYAIDTDLMDTSEPVQIEQSVLPLLLKAGKNRVQFLEQASSNGGDSVLPEELESARKANVELSKTLSDSDSDESDETEVQVNKYALRLLTQAARGEQGRLRESGDEQWKYYAKAWDKAHEALQNSFRMQDFDYENPPQQ